MRKTIFIIAFLTTIPHFSIGQERNVVWSEIPGLNSELDSAQSKIKKENSFVLDALNFMKLELNNKYEKYKTEKEQMSVFNRNTCEIELQEMKEEIDQFQSQAEAELVNMQNGLYKPILVKINKEISANRYPIQNIKSDVDISLAANSCANFFIEQKNKILNFYKEKHKLEISINVTSPLIFNLGDSVIFNQYYEYNNPTDRMQCVFFMGEILFGFKPDTGKVSNTSNGLLDILIEYKKTSISEGNTINLFGNYLVNGNSCIFPSGNFEFIDNENTGKYAEGSILIFNGHKYAHLSNNWVKK